MKKPLTFICRQKINHQPTCSPFTLFLIYYKDIVNLLFWVLWACLGTQTQSDTINLQKNFVFFCRQKINFTPPHLFLEILQRYANLFCVFWACLVAQTQNDSINVYKTSMFICMTKINFIVHFFLEILHFKESCNLIDWQYFGPWLENQNFARHGIGGEISQQ